MSNCTDRSWCLGSKNTTCCDQQLGVFIVANNETVPVLAPSNTSSTIQSTTSPTAIVPPTTSSSVPPSGLSGGAKAGIGVGAAAGALLAAGVAYFFFMRQRKRKHQAVPIAPPADTVEKDATPANVHEKFSAPVFEKDGTRLLSASHEPVEMQG